MKSIKTKVIVLVFSCVLLSSLSIGITSILNARRVVQADSTKIMNLLCENRANSFNEVFKRIEQSVETLSIYTKRDIGNLETFKSSHNEIDRVTNHMLATAVDAAENTEGAISVYLRFDPSFADSKAGLFCVKDEETNTFRRETPTDLAAYAINDAEHVGWFYQTKEKGTAIWISPYVNKNIDRTMISYVVPIYVDNEFIGVAGMDIDFRMMEEIVSNTKIYETGYAFLTDDQAKIVFHGKLRTGTNLIAYNHGEFRGMASALLKDKTEEDDLIYYNYEGTRKAATYRSLENGMRFILSAPRSEIDQQSNELLYQIIAGMAFFVSITTILTFIFVRRLTRPVLELNEAAKQITKGDLSITISHHAKDEVGELAESLRQTVAQLNQSFSYINALAYKDSMTGVRNKTAYIEMVRDINDRLGNDLIDFTVVVFDVNGLKDINDRLGHVAGDQLLVSACEIICNVFKKYPVYRIGGDEFVVLMAEDSKEEHGHYFEIFSKEIKEKTITIFEGDTIRISVASGMAHYNSTVDTCYDDVFKKADQAMYQCKNNMKKK